MGAPSFFVVFGLGFYALIVLVGASFLFQGWRLLRLKVQQNEIRLATMKDELAKREGSCG